MGFTLIPPNRSPYYSAAMVGRQKTNKCSDAHLMYNSYVDFGNMHKNTKQWKEEI